MKSFISREIFRIGALLWGNEVFAPPALKKQSFYFAPRLVHFANPRE
jgi:hypothetical protein